MLSPVPKQEQWGRKDRVALGGVEEEVLPTLNLVALGNGASWLRQWTHICWEEDEFSFVSVEFWTLRRHLCFT